MRLKFITLAMLSRCCSHCQLFCSSASLRNVSIFVWQLRCKDGAVVFVAGEHRKLLLLHGPRGIRHPAVSWLSGGGGTLPSQHMKFFFNRIEKLLVLRLLLPRFVPMGSSPLTSMKCAGRGVGRSFQMCFFTTKACVLILWRYSVRLFPWSHGYCFFDFH